MWGKREKKLLWWKTTFELNMRFWYLSGSERRKKWSTDGCSHTHTHTHSSLQSNHIWERVSGRFVGRYFSSLFWNFLMWSDEAFSAAQARSIETLPPQFFHFLSGVACKVIKVIYNGWLPNSTIWWLVVMSVVRPKKIIPHTCFFTSTNLCS